MRKLCDHSCSASCCNAIGTLSNRELLQVQAKAKEFLFPYLNRMPWCTSTPIGLMKWPMMTCPVISFQIAAKTIKQSKISQCKTHIELFRQLSTSTVQQPSGTALVPFLMAIPWVLMILILPGRLRSWRTFILAISTNYVVDSGCTTHISRIHRIHKHTAPGDLEMGTATG